ncbi:MAG: hypothetical protein VZR56_00290 [Treponema sp.]|nr:hypothetical protein [Treponema sp.]MEE3312573.1 hypothetical protein [Treponema sp.]
MQDLSNPPEVNFPHNQAAAHGLMGKSLCILERLAEQEDMKKKNSKNKSTIVLRDGVYTIRQNLETSDVKQDPTLKELVEAVIR